MNRSERKQGLILVAAGMCAIVTAVLLFGLMTSTGALDVVSVITTAAGAATVVIGLYQAFHHPRPHPSV